MATDTLIHHTPEYIHQRREIIAEHLEGIRSNPIFKDKSALFLESIHDQKYRMIILTIDIVNSTKLSYSMQPKEYERLISAFLLEVSGIIPRFHGHVLKYLGDGLIAYFIDSTESHIYGDEAVQCASAIQEVVDEVLNHAFEKKHIPRIKIRTALDSGRAYLTHVGSPHTKSQRDIIGKVVNTTVKMQSLAQPGRMVVGEDLYKHLDASLTERMMEVELPETWKFKNTRNGRYKIYELMSNYKSKEV